MAFTTNLATDVGKVRQYLWDLDPTNPLFPDDQMIQNFLDAELGDTKGAYAFALETIAGNQALTLKVMQLLDLKKDGKSTAEGLIAVAKQVRANSNNDWAGLDFAEVVDDSPFSYREYLFKQLMARRSGS